MRMSMCGKGRIRTNMGINKVVEINNPTKNTQQKELRNPGKDFGQKTVPISRSIVLQDWKISYMSSILSTHSVFKSYSQYYHSAISAPCSTYFQRQNPHCVLIYYIFTKSIPPLDMYLKKTKTLTRTDMCIPVYTAALFKIVETWNLCMFINR